MNGLDEELVRCARDGDLEGVRVALDAGADVHTVDDWPLRLATSNGCIEIVKVLLERGADVHAHDDEALRWASEDGRFELVQVLLERGADVHAHYDEALRWSCWKGHVDVVVKLVEARASLQVLGECWVNLFGCEAPAGLVAMGISGVMELLLAEMVAGELVWTIWTKS